MKELLILFIVCNIINVIIQTIKSLATIKGSPMVAAIVNAIAYGFYTYIIIITNYDLPIWQKMLIVALCNLIGVYIVKKIEEKSRKDKLWKIEATVKKEIEWRKIINWLIQNDIPYNYINIDKYILINSYCATQEESKKVKEILNQYHAKYFVSETKIL